MDRVWHPHDQEKTRHLVLAPWNGYTVRVCGILALLFIVIPAIEIYVLIEVGSRLGAPLTLAVLVATGVAGAALARFQGLFALRTVRAAVLEGREVASSIVAAALVLVAAILLLTPGFVTDVVALLLLVPPVRHPVARAVARRFAARVTRYVVVDPLASQHPLNDEQDRPPGKVIDI